MQLRKSVLFTAIALTGVLALSGCAPEAVNPTATPPVYEIPPVDAVVAGDVVDAEQAVSLNELDAKPGFRAFGMSDGTWVVVDSAAPLPAEVAADLQAQVDALPVATRSDDSQATEEALGEFVFRKNAETGRNVVVVTKLWAAVGTSANAPRVERWIHVGDSKQEVFMRPDGYVGTGTSEDYLNELYSGVQDAPQVEIFVHPANG